MSQVKEEPMDGRRAYIDKMAAQLKIWDSELKKLEAKAEKAKAELKINYAKQVEDLRDKKKAAQVRLKELQEAGGDAWKDLRVGVEKSWNELRTAIDSAFSKFK